MHPSVSLNAALVSSFFLLKLVEQDESDLDLFQFEIIRAEGLFVN